MKSDLVFSKIYLNCRRGMLELDIILTNFLKREYGNMDNELLNKFLLLLQESDNNLYMWLVKRMKPSIIYGKDISLLVSKINSVTQLSKK